MIFVIVGVRPFVGQLGEKVGTRARGVALVRAGAIDGVRRGIEEREERLGGFRTIVSGCWWEDRGGW